MAYQSARLLLALQLALLCARASGASSLSVPPAADVPAGRYSFASYDSRDGLRNLAIRGLAQDATGYLWVATEDGLYRYDGQRFRRFGTDEGLPSSLVSSLVTFDNGVWAGTPAGLVRLDTGGVESQAAGGDLSTGAITALAADTAVLWVGTPAGLFARRTGMAGFSQIGALPTGRIDALVARAGTLIAAQGRHLQQLGRTGVEHSWTLPEGGSRVDALAFDGAGILWARAGRQLWAIAPGQARPSEQTGRLSTLVEEGAFATDSSGALWVATLRGLYRRTASTPVPEEGWSVLDSRRGLPDVELKSVFEDREGTLWLAGSGLFRLLGRGQWQSYSRAEGMPSDHIWTVFRPPGGNFWAGTAGGLLRATAKGWELIAGTESQAVRALAVGTDGELLVAGSPLRIGSIDPKGPGTVEWTGPEAGLEGQDKILALTRHQGALWLATSGAGLWRSPESRPWRFERVELPDGEPAERTSDLLVDRAGRLWVAGQRGLAVLDAGRWQRFTAEDGLRATPVAYLAERANGEVCMAYREPVGASCLRAQGDAKRLELEHYDAARGLTAGRVYSLGEDRLGRLWFGTGAGIDVLFPDGWAHYGLHDGVPGDDCAARGFFADPNGEIWVATSTGLGRFFAPEHRLPEAPRPVLDAVRVDGESLAHSIDAVLEVGRGSSLEFAFGGLSFVDESQVGYSFRLAGFEPWRSGAARSATYANLPPGEYRFEVRSRLGNGPWSPPAALAVRVPAAWWQVRRYQALGAVALVSILLALTRLSRSALQRRNQDLEARNSDLASINEALQQARERIGVAAGQLETRAKEMLATAAEQNAVAEQQAAAVRQTGASVDAIAESARAASTRAEGIVDEARRSETVSLRGRKAVQDAAEAMDVLRVQVSATADRMGLLVEQGERIGDVLDAVERLAERSNIVALNASIEAARAGEAGRGFQVVAGEMSGLAEQSKQAANQIRERLHRLREESTEAARVSEAGLAKAEAAMKLARAADETIEELAAIIRGFTSAGQQIASDVRQQSVGLEQIAAGVDEFSGGTHKTVDGAQRLEGIARGLDSLAEGLARELERRDSRK